jgi:DNA-binding transcriptional MerR regulator
MDPLTLTVSEMASELGEKPRTVQFWAAAGVLQPQEASDRKGKGVHRRFAAGERRYGLVAKKLAALNSPISEISDIVERIRQFQAPSALAAPGKALDRIEAESQRGLDADNYAILDECYRLASIIGLFAIFRGKVDLFVIYYDRQADLQTEICFWPSSLHAKQVDYAKQKEGFVGVKIIRFDIDDLRDPPDLSNDEFNNWTAIFRLVIDLAAKALDGIKIERDLLDEYNRQVAEGRISEASLTALVAGEG